LVVDTVNEARFANLLYCGIDYTGLLAVACGLLRMAVYGWSGAWTWLWVVRDCFGWSGVWPPVGLIVCICLIYTCANETWFQVSDRNYPLLANAILLLEIGVKTGGSFVRSCRVGKLVIRFSQHACGFACANSSRSLLLG